MGKEQKPNLKGDILLYRRLVRHLRPYKAQFALVIIAMILTGLAEPALAALIKPLLDGSFVDKDPFYITWVPLALLGAMLLRGLGNFAVGAGMTWISEKVTIDIRNQVFAKLVMLPSSYYESQSTGKIISKLLFHVDNMKQTATQTLVPLVKDSVTIIALLIWMFYLNWGLALTIFMLAPAMVLIISFVSRRLRRLSREIQKAVGEMMQTVEESVRNQKAVKIFVAQEQEKRRAAHMFNHLRHLGFKLTLASGANGVAIQTLTAVTLACVVYFSALQSMEGEVTVGGFVSFFGAMALLLSPIKRLARINETLQAGLAAAESVFGVLDLEDEPQGGARRIERANGKLEFRNVSFSYPGQDEPALRDISFTAGPNQTVAIVGLSGSGKSTIASLIPLLHHPDSGQILLDDTDIRELDLQSLRKQISFVSQDILLFNDTVRNNIAYGPHERDEADIRRATDAAHASEFIDQLPEGMDTMIGQSGLRLSGGQRQRIIIARAILKDTPVLIFDEATSSLDTNSEQKIQNAIDEIRQNRTLIIIAHRLSTIENADKIIVIDKGSIIESGTHTELLKKKGVYSNLYSLKNLDGDRENRQ